MDVGRRSSDQHPESEVTDSEVSQKPREDGRPCQEVNLLRRLLQCDSGWYWLYAAIGAAVLLLVP